MIAMSPLFALVALAVFVGVGLLVAGLIFRKVGLVIIGAPPPVILLIWVVMAGLPPEPNREFDQMFGYENRAFAEEVETIKPWGMDGFFFSFRMEKEDFEVRILPEFSAVGNNFDFLRGEGLPESWPLEMVGLEAAFEKKVGNNDVLIWYDWESEMVYGSNLYDQW